MSSLRSRNGGSRCSADEKNSSRRNLPAATSFSSSLVAEEINRGLHSRAVQFCSPSGNEESNPRWQHPNPVRHAVQEIRFPLALFGLWNAFCLKLVREQALSIQGPTSRFLQRTFTKPGETMDQASAF